MPHQSLNSADGSHIRVVLLLGLPFLGGPSMGAEVALLAPPSSWVSLLATPPAWLNSLALPLSPEWGCASNGRPSCSLSASLCPPYKALERWARGCPPFCCCCCCRRSVFRRSWVLPFVQRGSCSSPLLLLVADTWPIGQKGTPWP